MDDLRALLGENETWLMERILSYARQQGYTRYTSTLVEAWRVSISGLSTVLIRSAEAFPDRLPEFTPHENLEDDPLTAFGVTEARLHMKRGVSLPMFLGLYKYYRYTFQDLVQGATLPEKRKEYLLTFVQRCFDRLEIAFCSQWSALDVDMVISELQDANRTMTNEKNKYLTLFESLDVPTLLVDEQGFLENANAPANRLLQRSHAEGAMYYSSGNRTSRQREHLSSLLPWLGEYLERLLHIEERSFRVELVEPKERGGRIFQATFSRMRDVSGKFRGGVVILDDVTESRCMEQLKEDVERITRHDLKVPLSGILSVCSCILDERPSVDEQTEMLRMARDSGYAMLGMINRSLDIYKMERGAYHFSPQRVALNTILRRVAEHSYPLLNMNRGTLSFDIDGRPLDHRRAGPFLLAEEMLLYTALGNLITNALEASPPKGEVRVSALAGKCCDIRIHNRGEVPEQIRDIFFEKYVTWGKKKGTGLGTYSARLIVETMGGNISMHSEKNSTTVTVRLPLAL